MPLVLVHNVVVANPAHQWNNIEGLQYHFPSNYRGLVQTGEPFVYYRGVHRPGGKRVAAEYIGSGLIGKIRQDPDRKTAWYCAIDDYKRFPVPVAAKVNGENREVIAKNIWRNGVRDLDPKVYDEIIAEGLSRPIAKAPSPPEAVAIEPSTSLIVPPQMAGHLSSRKSSYRRSKRSKAIGDWAERAAIKYIQEQVVGCTDCVHRAAINETPGWDIDYHDAAGVLQRVEVKGTIAAAFTGVELTANELAAAMAHGDAYWLCLVASCETDHPKVQLIRDPWSQLSAGAWSSKPMVYAIRFVDQGSSS